MRGRGVRGRGELPGQGQLVETELADQGQLVAADPLLDDEVLPDEAVGDPLTNHLAAGGGAVGPVAGVVPDPDDPV